MPETDGFSVLKSLKDGEISSYKNQPVIAMTGSREHSRDFYFEKGFAEMLPKPFSKQELIVALKNVFPKKNNIVNNEREETFLEKSVDTTGKFDLSLLKSFLDTPQSLNEVLTVFDFQTEKDLQEIKTAISEKNIAQIPETAHRMLTMFRQIRANEVIPILEKMENYPETSGEISNLEAQMDYERLVMNVRDLQKALRNR